MPWKTCYGTRRRERPKSGFADGLNIRDPPDSKKASPSAARKLCKHAAPQHGSRDAIESLEAANEWEMSVDSGSPQAILGRYGGTP